jgi:hypothetical protein
MRGQAVLRVHAVAVRSLTPAQVDRMWQLYSEYYDNVDRPTFLRDLAEKDLVFLGTDADAATTVGFSTALFYTHRYGGRAVGIYFSGDTIIRPQYWGQTALHRAVTRELLRWKLRHPFTPLYWHLICSGVRTYLTLVRNFPTHWPDHRRATPRWERGLMDSICRARYGAAWKAERGVIALGGAQPVLRVGVAPITAELRRLPEIGFFIRANPGHLKGDELAMIARVDTRAVAGLVVKWVRKALRPRTQAGGRSLAAADRMVSAG